MLLGLMLYHLTARNDLIITVASGLTGPASPCFFLSGLSNPAAVTKWGRRDFGLVNSCSIQLIYIHANITLNYFLHLL